MFSLVDAGGLLLAMLLAGGLVALPGVALTRLFGLAGDGGAADLPTGVVAALAVLPVLMSLATRWSSLDAAIVLDLAIAVAGLAVLTRSRKTRSTWNTTAAVVISCWFAVLVVEWIDIDVGGALYQPLTIVDTVKHAATTQAILDSGAPPRDAFFLRPERASYYYFFYTLAAMVARASFGLVDAKAAVGGLVFWVGIGLYGLVRLASDRAGIVLACTGGRRLLLVVAVLAAGGLDVIADILMAWYRGYWVPDPFWWNPQVSIWTECLLWVPHHVSAVIAGAAGLVALGDLAAAPTVVARARSGGLAALAFASTLGLSVWVALALVASAGVWGLVLLVERRWRSLGTVVCAGFATLLLAAPQLIDMHAGRGGPLPIAFEVRGFALVDAWIPPGTWRTVARLLALPLNYFVEFGALAIGSVLYLRDTYFRDGGPRAAGTDFPRLLAIAAVTGLVLGALFASVIYNNDLGWRVMLFPMLAGSVWTIAAIDRRLAAPRMPRAPAWRGLPVALVAGLVLGWATSLCTFVHMRAYPWMRLSPRMQFLADDPRTERALRAAYDWADTNLPPSAVLQHNPGRPRAFAFGLYGRNRTAVSDDFGGLYGAPDAAVEARIDSLNPVYREPLPAAAVRAIAAKNGVDDLVVTDRDPVWKDAGSFVWTAEPVYASDRVRIIPVARLGG